MKGFSFEFKLSCKQMAKSQYFPKKVVQQKLVRHETLLHQSNLIQ